MDFMKGIDYSYYYEQEDGNEVVEVKKDNEAQHVQSLGETIVTPKGCKKFVYTTPLPETPYRSL